MSDMSALDSNDVNIEECLTNIAEFTSSFFKKYYQVDMIGLLTYLLNKMRRDNEYN